MKQLGILVFYINIGNLDSSEIDNWIEYTIKSIDPIDKDDETFALNHWERIYIPIRNENSRIQVIRNDEANIDDITLSELRLKLEQIGENMKFKANV